MMISWRMLELLSIDGRNRRSEDEVKVKGRNNVVIEDNLRKYETGSCLWVRTGPMQRHQAL